MTVPVLRPGDRVHLVGAGGAGMSALATVLLERGYAVTGSDLRYGRECAALAALGARITLGHDPANVEGADVVGASTAVPARNIELRRAGELGIPILHRAELLAALMATDRAVVIAGTHGKTTTTAMTTVALQAAGLDPSFAIGGTLSDSGTSAHHGAGEIFVAEADESDRSFLVYQPDCAVVTNVELDHHDHFGDLGEVYEAFARFLARRRPTAPAIMCLEHPGVRALLDRVEPPLVGYGESADAGVRLFDVVGDTAGTAFSLSSEGEDLGRFRVGMPGRHNVLNATAAVAVALWAKAPIEPVRDALASYRGTQRRFQRLGTVDGVAVVDDYAHHPTELTATIAAARQTQPRGRVVAAFQPHRFSRTAALGRELGRALGAADLVVVTGVYAAGEAPVPGVTADIVADAARATGVETHLVPATGDLARFVAGVVRGGDLVLTLGAGDVTEVGPVLLRLLEGRDG
jgi:UDP-N-acetylmuramate--alanine ligase